MGYCACWTLFTYTERNPAPPSAVFVRIHAEVVQHRTFRDAGTRHGTHEQGETGALSL